MSDEPKLTGLGKFFILLFVVACLGGAYLVFTKYKPAPGTASSNSSSAGAASTSATSPSGSGAQSPNTSAPAADAGGTIEIGVAFGTEKKRWLESAVEEFAKTSKGKNIRINLIPLGSIESAQAIVAGDQRIDAWTPASSIYTENFSHDFELKHSRNPIARQEQLALTPMVIVSWKERSIPFISRYKAMSFTTIGEALKMKDGWGGIAQKPDWGFFKFAHTHPNQSASGMAALILMAYDYHDKIRGLTLSDILDPKFQSWMIDLESSVTDMPNSTGNLMKDMVLKGPSSYDAVLVYESVAIDYLKNAEGRWGELAVVYPKHNIWSDNPYYVLDTPWGDRRRKEAATTFMNFLLTEPIQRLALTHGFRPGNPAVPILFPESPFTQYQRYGLKVDLTSICEPPKSEVIQNLRVGWNNNVRRN
jgi:Ca-activated chloride channel family protein